MKKINLQLVLAVVLSVIFVSVTVWDGFTHRLGGLYRENETRHGAVVVGIVFAGIVSLVLFGLVVALKKKRRFAQISWIVIAPTLLMESWDTITRNLVENGRIGAGWLTDSAYHAEPGANLHRTMWIISGILIALPFLYNVYKSPSTKKPKRNL